MRFIVTLTATTSTHAEVLTKVSKHFHAHPSFPPRRDLCERSSRHSREGGLALYFGGAEHPGTSAFAIRFGSLGPPSRGRWRNAGQGRSSVLRKWSSMVVRKVNTNVHGFPPSRE